MLLEQRGALLHLTSDRSSGLGNCAEHVLPADNHADDIDDWNHRLGALPALPRPPSAAHAGKAEVCTVTAALYALSSLAKGLRLRVYFRV